MLITFFRVQKPMKPNPNPRRNAVNIFSRSASFACFVFLALALTGCSFLHFKSSAPKAQVSSIQLTNLPTGPVTFPVLQQQVMRFADTYVATIAQACDDVGA